MDDIKDVTRYSNEVQCKTCFDVVFKTSEHVWYKNGICPACRDDLPKYIPVEQHVRFLLTLRKRRKQRLWTILK